MTLSIMTINVKIKKAYLAKMTVRHMTLSIRIECRNAECHIFKGMLVGVSMQNVVTFHVVAPSPGRFFSQN